jgi:hypothetical protein
MGNWACVQASGYDVKVTLVVIMDIPEDLGTLDMFWDFMERRGFTFMRNPDYTHCNYDVSDLHPLPFSANLNTA